MRRSWSTHGIGILLATGFLATLAGAETVELQSLYPMPVGTFERVNADNVVLPDGNRSTATVPLGLGNLFLGGDTRNGENGMRLFGGDVNDAAAFAPDSPNGGYLDVHANDPNFPNVGLYFRVDNLSNGQGGSTERMRIVAATGNVGINTQNPASSRLYVTEDNPNGNLFTATFERTSNDSVGSVLSLRKSRAGGPTQAGDNIGALSWHFIDSTGNLSTGASIRGFVEDPTGAVNGDLRKASLAFQTLFNGGIADRMTLTSSGNLGIGTTTPTSLLEIAGRSGIGAPTPSLKLFDQNFVLVNAAAKTELSQVAETLNLTSHRADESQTAPIASFSTTLASLFTDVNLGGFLNFAGRNQPPVSAAGQARVYFDRTSNALELSENGGAYREFGTPLNVLNGSFTGKGNPPPIDTGIDAVRYPNAVASLRGATQFDERRRIWVDAVVISGRWYVDISGDIDGSSNNNTTVYYTLLYWE